MPPQPRPLQSLAARSAPCHAFGGRDEAAKLVDDHAGHCGAEARPLLLHEHPQAAFTIEKAVDEATVVAGQPIHYHVTVVNAGNTALTL